MAKIIGIDLGTTNSIVAVFEGGLPVIISNEVGNRLIPSVVRIIDDEEIIVGEHALRSRLLHPFNTITGIKRLIGRRFNEVIDIAQTVPYNVVIGQNNLATVEIEGKHYSPQLISAFILKSLKESAEKYLGAKVDKAVITVPAYFNDPQREATKQAARIAGLKVMRIINEPTSAALAFGLDKKKDETLAVFDLGGGTFDISILEVGEGVVEVKAVSGDGFLGGDDFNEKIVNWVVEEIYFETGIEIDNNIEAMQRIRAIAEEAKCMLSVLPEFTLTLPFLTQINEDIYNLSLILTRTKFEQICEELFEKLIPPCEEALRAAGLTADKIDRVLLVGGATRMPKITEIIWRIFEKEPSKTINPDEAVALGAATQGAVLDGDKTDILLLDVTPYSLGIENASGMFIEMLPENTTIPTRKSEIFSNSQDYQTTVEIHIMEGNSPLAINNRSLARLILRDISNELRGQAQIEVTFDIDANGIVNVEAKDIRTGRSERVQVINFTGLGESNIKLTEKKISSIYVSDFDKS